LIHKNNQKTNQINTTGSLVNYLGFSYCNDYKKDADQIQSKEVPSGSGAGMLIPADLVKKIGAFDERFFMYSEDLDLSWRARRAGYSIQLIPEAKLWHKYNFSKNKIKFYYAERNRLFFIFKNLEIKTLLLIFPILLINEILVLSLSAVQGWPIQKIHTYGSLIGQVGYIWREKKRGEMLSVRSDRDLKKYLSSELSFLEVKVPLMPIYEKIISLYWRLIYKAI
jgi:GT2 family glycosyltransferase